MEWLVPPILPPSWQIGWVVISNRTKSCSKSIGKLCVTRKPSSWDWVDRCKACESSDTCVNTLINKDVRTLDGSKHRESPIQSSPADSQYRVSSRLCSILDSLQEHIDNVNLYLLSQSDSPYLNLDISIAMVMVYSTLNTNLKHWNPLTSAISKLVLRTGGFLHFGYDEWETVFIRHLTKMNSHFHTFHKTVPPQNI